MPAGPVMRPGAEAWHGGLSTWAMGCGRGVGHSLSTVRRGRSWSSYAEALKASGWDPLHVQWCSSGCAGWADSERDTDSYQIVPKPRRNLPLQQQSSSTGFYSSFDSRVKGSTDPPRLCLVSADALLHPPLLFRQIELYKITVSQVSDYGWDSQRFVSTVSISPLL